MNLLRISGPTGLKGRSASTDIVVIVKARASAGGQLANRYELKSAAGTGGMGTVYQAIDLVTNKLVAVKVLHGKRAGDFGRFKQEAEMLAELRHPSIVRFVDHGTTADQESYLVMEWLEGETLEARISRGALTSNLTARLGTRILEALGAAHVKNIVHRDIKPSNIFLRGYRATDAKLLDFGVARRTFDPKKFTREGSTVGTPMYTSPEQARAERHIDGRADIFSLGCVLYEALTCEPAFWGKSPGAVMTRICAGQPPRVAERLPHLDPEMAAVIQDMLIQDRDERPRDARRLAMVFGHIAERLGPGDLGDDAERLPPRKRPARDALSHGEQRMMTVLVLGVRNNTGDFAGDSAGDFAGDFASRVLDDAMVRQLGNVIEPYGGRLDRLLNNSAVITAPGFATQDEQATQIARIALAVARAAPDLALVAASGRGILLARLPSGEVVECAVALLESARCGAIQLDGVTAQLLQRRFQIEIVDACKQLVRENENRIERPLLQNNELATPFVGRERERDVLEGLFEECVEEGVSRVSVVTGLPGVGKTRFVEQIVQKITAGENATIWRTCGRVGHGRQTMVAMEPLLRVAGITDVHENDPAAVLRAWCDFVRTETEQGPVILILDDAHLADAPSLQLLDATLRELRDAPLLILLASRPDLWDRFPQLFDQRAPEKFRLSPLMSRHAEAMVDTLMPAAGDHLKAWVLERAGGIPGFIEQLVRFALAGPKMLLPETVIGVVQGRLDGISDDGKRILRAASIYGNEATTDGIQALLGDMPQDDFERVLSEILGRGLLEETADASKLRFREVIVREAVFMTLAPGDRALGRRLARAHLEQDGRGGADLPAELQPGSTAVEVPAEFAAGRPMEAVRGNS